MLEPMLIAGVTTGAMTGKALASGSLHSGVEGRSHASKQVNKNEKFTYFFKFYEDKKG